MTLITANNATTVLASNITNVATSITVTTGQGARFPTVAAPDVLMLTLDDGVNVEVVKCTAHTAAADTFTIVRSVEQVQTAGPTAFAFNSGTKVEARMTKGMVENTEPVRLPLQNLNPTTAATSGSMYVYGRGISGRAMLKWMAPSGIDYLVQPTLFDNQILLYRAGVAHVTGSGIGGSWAYGGSLVGQLLPMSPTWSGSISGSMRRSRLVTAATSASNMRLTAYSPSGSGFVWRGLQTGDGGFFFHSRIWDPSGSSHLGRLCVGLGMDTSSVLSGPYGPAQSPNSIFFGYHETGSYGGYAVYRIGMAGTASGVATGFTKVTTTPTSRSRGNLLDVFMFAPPNGPGIQVRVDLINSDGTSTTIHDELFTTFLPVQTTLLSPRVEIQASAAISSAIEVSSIYLESDF
jgi:hypothetical protein